MRVSCETDLRAPDERLSTTSGNCSCALRRSAKLAPERPVGFVWGWNTHLCRRGRLVRFVHPFLSVVLVLLLFPIRPNPSVPAVLQSIQNLRGTPIGRSGVYGHRGRANGGRHAAIGPWISANRLKVAAFIRTLKFRAPFCGIFFDRLVHLPISGARSAISQIYFRKYLKMQPILSGPAFSLCASARIRRGRVLHAPDSGPTARSAGPNST